MNRRENDRAHCLAVGFFALLLLVGCREDAVPDQPASGALAPTDNPPADNQRSAKLPFASPVERTLRALRPDDWFAEMSQDSGLSFTYRDGSQAGLYQLLESVGGGVAATDFDCDGWPDLCIAGGGTLQLISDAIAVRGLPVGLFRNAGGERFLDVSASSAIQSTSLYSHGVTSTDLDADGFSDLVVCGFHGIQIWLNLGDGTFRECSGEFGVQAGQWNSCACEGDVDNDGLVDLYVMTYADWKPDRDRICHNDRQMRDICGPTLFPGARDSLFVSHGSGFEEATERAALVAGNRGLGIVSADIDRNGHIDFVVVNDVDENQLYFNDGVFPWREEGVIAGVAYSSTGQREGSMGIDLGDFDGDGRADIWYTNYTHQDNSLLRNIDGTGFIHFADVVGLAGVSRKWVGFGTNMGDFDGDTWPDLYVINGHVAYERLDSPYFQPPQLFASQQGKRFVDASGNGGAYFEHDRSGRGSTCFDWNRDGALDVVVVHQNEPVALLQNQHSIPHWISIRLVGTTTERTATGAQVDVKTSSRLLSQWRHGGGSYLSDKLDTLLFALPDDSVVTVTVTWLGNATQSHDLLPGSYTIVEGGAAYESP